MKTYIDDLLILISEPLHYIQILSEKNENYSWFEFISTLIASISISVSMYYISPPYFSGFLGIIFFMILFNFSMLKLISTLFILFFNWNLEKQKKSGDYKLLYKIMNQLNFIFILTLPLSIISVRFEFTKFSGFVFSIFPLILLYIYFIVEVSSFIYSSSKLFIFRKIISTLFIILFLPFSFIIYYMMQLSYFL